MRIKKDWPGRTPGGTRAWTVPMVVVILSNALGRDPIGTVMAKIKSSSATGGGGGEAGTAGGAGCDCRRGGGAPGVVAAAAANGACSWRSIDARRSRLARSCSCSSLCCCIADSPASTSPNSSPPLPLSDTGEAAAAPTAVVSESSKRLAPDSRRMCTAPSKEPLEASSTAYSTSWGKLGKMAAKACKDVELRSGAMSCSSNPGFTFGLA
mmetsp:Transcript_34374/g.68293  ORF Transcript_34374/g.68293 Transcript_34374/m.68293 type:complete len:210 (-) Transcript_34374:309-938(-)